MNPNEIIWSNWNSIMVFGFQKSFFSHDNLSLTSTYFVYRLYEQESENQIRTFIQANKDRMVSIYPFQRVLQELYFAINSLESA